MEPDRDLRPFLLFLLITLLIVCAGLFTPLRDRISFHIDDLKSRLFYMQNDPSASLFVPGQQGGPTADPQDIEATISQFITEPAPTETEVPPAPTEAAEEITAEPTATEIPTNTPEPTATPEPLPERYFISGVKYETQHGIWNYCAPTNLSMAMTYWGWRGQRTDIGPKVKPFNKDKNVMFYELEEYVTDNSGLRSVVRPGGDAELMKRLIVKDYPVLIEKGSFMQEVSGRYSWMGHYNVVTGYDDEAQEWTGQASYYNADYKVSYQTREQEWHSFNHQGMVVYPGDREGDVYSILGPYTNNSWAVNHALRMADAQIEAAETPEEYFYAYFNRGSSQVELSDFFGAAQSYDMAYTYYPDIEQNRRPYRIVWYQTGPYYAYYYCGRYYDVIQLAETTLASTSEPYLEESHYWRAMAYNALGEIEKAHDDLETCLQLHPGFTACEGLMYELGY